MYFPSLNFMRDFPSYSDGIQMGATIKDALVEHKKVVAVALTVSALAAIVLITAVRKFYALSVNNRDLSEKLQQLQKDKVAVQEVKQEHQKVLMEEAKRYRALEEKQKTKHAQEMEQLQQQKQQLEKEKENLQWELKTANIGRCEANELNQGLQKRLDAYEQAMRQEREPTEVAVQKARDEVIQQYKSTLSEKDEEIARITKALEEEKNNREIAIKRLSEGLTANNNTYKNTISKLTSDYNSKLSGQENEYIKAISDCESQIRILKQSKETELLQKDNAIHTLKEQLQEMTKQLEERAKMQEQLRCQTDELTAKQRRIDSLEQVADTLEADKKDLLRENQKLREETASLKHKPAVTSKK